jgi:C-terminal processing protease CtpA/Prc
VHGNFEGGVVRWQDGAGDVSEAYVPGYTIADYRRKSPSMTLPQFTKDDREFRFIDDVAYLRPGLFLNLESSNISEHEAFESGEFLHFLDSAFAEIAAGNPSSLIIDIRGNNGGDNSFSDPMIAYFADRPFRMTSRFSVRTSELTKTFWQDLDIDSLAGLKEQIMTLPNGTRFEADLGEALPRNDELSFKGLVYVLVDRFSFSNAAVAAAIIQDYGFGILIGEETSYVPSSCGAIHTFTLPVTEQTVIYSNACSVRPNGDTAMRGVIPDIARQQ